MARVRRSGIGGASLALLGATFVFVLPCSVAGAASAPTVATHSKTAVANAQTPVDAKCPSGKFPVSGGHELEGEDTFAFNSLEGIFNPRRWSLTTVATPEAAQVTAIAYCSPIGRNGTFGSDQIELSTGESATLTATCKRGEKVLSGSYAFVSSGLGVGLVNGSFRADSRSWSIKGVNFGENDLTLIAFANCAPKRQVPRLKAARETVRFNDEGPTTATASCGTGHYALSGGFTFPDPAEAISTSERVGTRDWRITTAGGINGRDDDLTALAYCARK